MEDRYLFRGKRIDTGEWIVGSLLVDKQQDIDTGEQIEITGIYPSEYKDFAKKIDPSTICQCTGRKDKNGKLIYENDIMVAYYDEENPAMVVWRECGFVAVENNNDDTYPLDYFTQKHFYVVGNIFDNPELFEGEI